MFSKIFAAISIAVLVATNVAASVSLQYQWNHLLLLPIFHKQIPPGIYKVTNVETHSWVRSYSPEIPLFVSPTKEYPGDFALVSIGVLFGLSTYI